MDAIIEWFSGIDPIWGALIATTFTWFVTALGASLVFFFKGMNRKVLDGMLGFTGGVMVAASLWSLIIPALNMGEQRITKSVLEANPGLEESAVDLTLGQNMEILWPVLIGFSLGALFLFGLDKILPHLHINFKENEAEGPKTDWHRTTLLVLAITLHNIPEGLAVGVLFGGVAAGIPEATISGAVILAIGIGIQNFPEGIAVSMPLRRQGVSRWKSFWFGQLSAIVEPIAGVVGALAVTFFEPALPYALAFAAGAMIFVVVEEVVPETQRGGNTDIATLSFIFGFIVMMTLDVALG